MPKTFYPTLEYQTKLKPRNSPLSERLKRIIPAMRIQGYVIEFERTKKARNITITKQEINAPVTVNLNKSFLEKILALPYSIEDGED